MEQHNSERRESADFEMYDPELLIDSLLDHLHLDNDEALARALDVGPEIIKDIRQMKRPVDGAMLIRMHELTGIATSGLRNILGDRRMGMRFDEGTEAP